MTKPKNSSVLCQKAIREKIREVKAEDWADSAYKAQFLAGLTVALSLANHAHNQPPRID